MSYPKLSENICLACGSRFLIKRKRDLSQIFCNRKCAAIVKLNKFIKNCLTCNKQFATIPSENFSYCSRNCSNKSKIIIHLRKCERCLKQFILDNIAYEKRGDGKFCSRECGTRVYEFDETYFKNIDTPEKSYWLGMLFADGNLYRSQMTLKLQRKDKNHLKKFQQALSAKHPIHDGVSKNGHEFSSFLIGSKLLASQLNNVGMFPNKTFNLEFPKLNNDLIPHFIRGYFDGDGCMYVNGKYHTWSIFSASTKFVNQLFDYLSEQTGIKFNKNKNTISLSKGQYLIKLKHYLYDNATIFLERKYEKFLLAGY